MRFRDTGTRLRGATVAGVYGNPAAIDWTEAGLGKVDYPCEFQPEPGRTSSVEDVQQQQRVLSHWVLFLPAGADITDVDRWRFLGIDYEVESIKPRRARGKEHHLELRVLRVSGG
jgi:hypothetical protein